MPRGLNCTSQLGMRLTQSRGLDKNTNFLYYNCSYNPGKLAIASGLVYCF